MKKFLFGLFALVLVAGCVQKSTKQGQQKTTENVDTIALKDAAFKSKLIQEEGIKAIGNIDFYISKEEFDKQQKIFKEPLYHTNINDNGYFLGEYNFTNIDGNFLNDSLLNVHFWGNTIKYDEYASKMPNQYNALLSILNTKYGLPEYEKELPEWSKVPSENVVMLGEWNLGFKRLLVWVVSIGANYRLDFAYYVPEMATRKNEIEKEESIKTNQKAAEIL